MQGFDIIIQNISLCVKGKNMEGSRPSAWLIVGVYLGIQNDGLVSCAICSSFRHSDQVSTKHGLIPKKVSDEICGIINISDTHTQAWERVDRW